MYILGISGSPRVRGNTDILLDKALEGARIKGARTEKIILNDLRMVPCQECEKIRDDGTCKIKDDFQILYKKIKKADALILASPIFFGSVSAQTKIMIDRFQCHWMYKYVFFAKRAQKKAFKKKIPGGLILVEASTRTDFLENAKSIARNLFAVIDVKYKKQLFCRGVDKKGKVRKYPTCLRKARELGKALL